MCCFEDAIAGIEAANAADMYAIGVGDPQTLKNADVVFNDFTKLTVGFLNNLLN